MHNDCFDANDFFNNAAGRTRPPFRMNQFGYAVGGPVILPRFGEGSAGVYNGRNRSFFFTDYQGRRYRRRGITGELPILTRRAVTIRISCALHIVLRGSLISYDAEVYRVRT